jgi:hypothetical protein
MKNYILFSVFIIIHGLSIFEINAQKLKSETNKPVLKGYIKVTGNVEQNNKPLEKAIINIYLNKNKSQQLNTGPDGKFSIDLEFNKDYIIQLSKPGLVTKKFEFNTHLPDSANKDINYPFSFTIVLFPTYKNFDLSILDKPLAIVRYDNQYKEFFYDYDYARYINEKVLAIQDRIEYLTIEYEKCMQDGNKQLNSKQYEDALKNFRRANEIFPDESIPVEKINSIINILQKQN